MTRYLGLRARLALLALVALVPICGLFAWSASQARTTALQLARADLQTQAYRALSAAARAERHSGSLQAALSHLVLPPGAVLAVTNARGVVLASLPPGALAPGGALPDPAAREALAAGRMDIFEARDSEGRRALYAFATRRDQAGAAPTEAGPATEAMFAAVSVPRAVVVWPPLRVMLIQVGALLATLLAGILLARWMGERLIVRPAKAMLREAQEVAAGNLEARVDVSAIYQGELAMLCRALNDMAASLQARRAEMDASLAQTGREHALLGLIIDSMSEGVIAIDTDRRLLLFNTAARRIFPLGAPGLSLEQLRADHALVEPGSDRPQTVAESPLARALRGESADNIEVHVRGDGLGDRVISINIRPLYDARQTLVGGLSVFSDITERKAAESLVRDQERVLELIASGLPLAPSLEAVIALIEGRVEGGMCSILLREGERLSLCAAPHLPAPFRRALDGLPIAEGAGACGTAAFRGETVVVEDARTDPLAGPWREPALAAGLLSCWSTPVLSAGGEVLGAFATYFHLPRRPRPRELEMMESAVRLARVAIERAMAEDALRGSEELFRSMFDTAAVGIAITDAQGRFLRANAAYCEMLGYTEDELRGVHFPSLTHPDDRGHQMELRRQVTAGERDSYTIEKRHLRKDGTAVWSRVTLSAARRPDGTLISTTGLAEDITGRMAAAEEIARINRSLQVLSRCNEALMRVEDERELLLEICRIAVDVGGYRLAWVGYARDDAQRSVVPMAHAGHEDGYLSEIRLSWDANVATGKGPVGRTIRGGKMVVTGDITAPASGFHWLAEARLRGFKSLVCLPLRDGPRTFGLLALYSSEAHAASEDELKLLGELADNLAFGTGNLRARLARNRAQEKVAQLNDELEARVRQRTAQLEEANRELEAFSYSVSHDLRTPLSAIDGFSGMLEKATATEGNERARHYLGRIRAGVRQMGSLIDDLLSLAQVSRASMRDETVDIGAMARRVAAGLAEHEPARQVAFHAEDGLVAQGDWRLILRVVENLVGNAWKFTSRTEAAQITVGSAGASGDMEIFFVRDNGAGFDMAYAEKLFGTFQRLHTADEFPGTGIGLATVHRIVTRHGGQAWAQGAPGQGATFYFSLPAPRSAA